MRQLTCRIKAYIQPFERQLALEELKALTAGKPLPSDGSTATAVNFRVTTNTQADALLSQLAYWETVTNTQAGITAQAKYEATSIIARNGVSVDDLPATVPLTIASNLPNKRCLRYATHGLHEYRGKFFPQLVRAFINMARVPSGGIVVDPMCGSGTTIVEAILAGRRAYGLDLNPLSVFVSTVKCDSLRIKPAILIAELHDLERRLKRTSRARSRLQYFETLPETDRLYLQRWFDISVLRELDQIQTAIFDLRPAAVRNFFRLCLSNILREVSWQKEDDLRVRKELRTLEEEQVLKRFLNEALRSTKTLVAFLAQRGQVGLGSYNVREADARHAGSTLKLKGQVDAVVTSPPYATALPYLDTDRLSLVYLGLLSRHKHRKRDTLMIGNREITERIRLAYWHEYREGHEVLPKETRALINEIEDLNRKATVGFRRRNLSALLSKYFFDMRAVIQEQFVLLKPGALMFMVIGNNRTTAGGKEVEIRTTHHLTKIAQSVGFRLADTLSMEMLTSRDIFRKNAMASEEILTLQKDQ